MTEENVTFDFYLHRGLSKTTLRHYDIKTKFVNGVPVETGFYYPEPNGYKFRKLGDDVPKRERFYQTDGMGSPGLYGKDKFDPGSKDSITICEGMYDAPSVYDMTRGATAAVAVSSSGQALRDVTKDREYINSFKKIYLCFDHDDPGQKATREIATSGVFDYNKLYIVKFHKHKDPNDYLVNQDADEFVNCWKSARRYSPDNIISTFSEIENSLKKNAENQIATYPWEHLNNSLYGMHEGEVVVWKGLEKRGKTELFRAIEHHILKTTDHNIGIIHLEEDNDVTVKALAGYELEVPAVLPDCGLTIKDIMDGFKKAVKNDEGRVHIYSSFETEDENALLDNIRFLVSVAKCKFIFLDHITWLATGMDTEDERKKLDRISQKLKLLAKELRFCLHMISHVNDNGQTRGSRNITKVANTIIHINRDIVSLNAEERNTIYLTIEGARLGGRTGPGGILIFNMQTGKLVDKEFYEKKELEHVKPPRVEALKLVHNLETN